MPSHGEVRKRRSSQLPTKNPTSGATISRVGMVSRSPAERRPSYGDFLSGSGAMPRLRETFHKRPATDEALMGGGQPREGRERSARGQVGSRPEGGFPEGEVEAGGVPAAKIPYRASLRSPLKDPIARLGSRP